MAQKWLKQLQATNAQNALNAQSQHNEIDADGDGKLTATELAQACQISILEAENLIEQYDADGDGTLDEQEFENLKLQIREQQQQQQSTIINSINANTDYTHLDTNNDGKLSAQELAQACNITLEDAQDVIQQYDANGDGMLDSEEFEDLKLQILEQQRINMTDNINETDTYAAFDADSDGKLSAKELAAACNISEEEAQNIIYQFDADGDGMLDQNEFQNLKQQILEQQQSDMNINVASEDYKDVAAYQSAVYDNDQAQMAIDGRDKTDSTDNAPVFGGDMSRVNASEYDTNNSNAQAFGVDIFADKNDKKVQQNNVDKSMENNGGPFGKAETKVKNSKSPFGKRPGDNGYNSPFGKPPGGYGNENNKSKPTAPSGIKPKFKHKWSLGIKFDANNEQILLNVSDETTHKKWKKVVTKQEHSGDIKQEYFRIGKLLSRGIAKYTYPPKGVGAVQVSLSQENDVYHFYGQPLV